MSFFVEAIFLGIYLYGWDRMPPRRHLAMLIPMGVSGVVGTFCVVSVNAWMNHPAGFDIRDGQVVNVNPWRAMFNDAVWLQFLHMWVAAFMVVGLLVSGVYAAGLLRGRDDPHHRLGFTVPFAFATVAALAQPFIGHVLGMRIHDTQPAKLAAFELAETTESPSPLRLGGVLIDGEVQWCTGHSPARVDHRAQLARCTRARPGRGARIRSAAGQHHPSGVSVDDRDRHAAGRRGDPVLVLRWRRHDLLGNRWFLRFAVIAGPLAVLALEFGWIATEVGRQPWTVWQILRTSEAASMSTGLWWSYTGRVGDLCRYDRGRLCGADVDGPAVARR